MSRELAIRAFGLYAPMALAAAAWVMRTRPRKQARTDAIAAMMATIWALISLPVVHVIAIQAGWWTYEASGGTLLGMPVDLYMGWACTWGAVPMLAFPRAPLAAVVALFTVIDIVLMPLCAPVVRLGDRWLIGEAVAIVICLIPALLLGRWTRHGQQLFGRVTLQVLGFSTFMLWLLPAIILEQTGGSWSALTSLHATSSHALSFALQVLAVPAVLGISAVCEFARRGGGTPVPFDPPKRLVTTGPYAYIANPMQTAMTLVFLGWGALLGSWWVIAAGAMAFIYSAGLAAWDEGEDLRARFGDRWIAYRRHVRPWWPRWRPFVMPDDVDAATEVPQRPPSPQPLSPGRGAKFLPSPRCRGEGRVRGQAPACLYVAAGCGQCSTIGRWLQAREPIGLTFVAAEDHPSRDLWRITYDPGDGTSDEEGVVAIGRALEHINFAWAFAGMAMRLPLVSFMLQAIVDASGGGPQRIRRRGVCSVPTPASANNSSRGDQGGTDIKLTARPPVRP
jgi:protein-S-isoprenylcysteine O-methyltransferase Ste14